MDSGDDPTSAKHAIAVSADTRPAAEVRTRVVIADDDPIILDPIATLLETRFDVVGRAANGRELLDTVRQLTPEVVVVDIAMPVINGIEAARQIAKTWSNVKIVMLSGYSDDDLVEAAFEAGASGYVVKLRAFTDLIPAIQNVLAGQPCCCCHVWPRRKNPQSNPE